MEHTCWQARRFGNTDEADHEPFVVACTAPQTMRGVALPVLSSPQLMVVVPLLFQQATVPSRA